MTNIGTPKELAKGENRVAMTPQSAQDLQKLGFECIIQSGAGTASRFSDADYKAAGVKVVKSAVELWKQADVVAKVRPPTAAETKKLRAGQTLISFIYPSENKKFLDDAAKAGSTVIAMDMVPRISRAQKMDALSSTANIAGYRAVIEAGNSFGRFFTGQITAAGKVPPAKVLVIGAGVAGLAAIGAAQSLGAIVRAFDVRPEVAEQIESMGAEFLLLDFDDKQNGAETGGYAAPSSPEFREKQLELFRAQAPDVDIVITTALIPGRDAPILWTKDMVEAMKPGSVIVDLAAERGGNCEATVKDEKIETKNGVTVIGYTDLASRMATQASTLYATNIRHMMSDLTPEKDGKINHDMEDDVIRGSTVTHKKKITFPPPPPKIAAIAKQAPKAPEPTAEEKAAKEAAEMRQTGIREIAMLTIGARCSASHWHGRPCQLHAAHDRFCTGLFRGLSGYLERLPRPAYAAYGGHECHFGHHNCWRSATSRGWQLACRVPQLRVHPNRINQHRWRFPRHPAHARHVPEIVRA